MISYSKHEAFARFSILIIVIISLNIVSSEIRLPLSIQIYRNFEVDVEAVKRMKNVIFILMVLEVFGSFNTNTTE